MSSLVVVVGGATTASAATPVYEITGEWVDQPDTIGRGEPVVGEWRVNVNDGDEPPSNDPVDNVVVEFTVENAFFDEIPDKCLTGGVTPASSISADGTVLTCNFGTVEMGTALVVQTPVVADGNTGDEVVLDGTSPDGQTVELDPIEIENEFAMDIHYGTNSGIDQWNDDFTQVTADIQWSLRLGTGSDPGPDTVSYELDVSEVNGADLAVGTNPFTGEDGCTRFDSSNAEGHPWSRTDIDPAHHRNTSFVDTCTLTQTGPNTFELTLSGINYDLLNAPSHDSARGGGNPLPPDWDYIASGSLWFSADTDEAGSIDLESDAPTYTSQTGQDFTDLDENNRTNKSYTRPGTWAAAWHRGYTNSGGTSWDDTYRVSAGTTLRQLANNRFSGDDAPPDSQYGNCLALDTEFVTLTDPDNGEPAEVVAGRRAANNRVIDTIQVEYYTGNNALVDPDSPQYDPDQFDCGADPGGWTTTEPADLSTVRAVRIRYPFSTYADTEIDGQSTEVFQLRAYTEINDDVPAGQDVWMFGSRMRQGNWVGPDAGNDITETPDARYPNTTGRRDIVRIITAVPVIQKEAAESTVTPGVPSEFTLTYAATGSGNIPDTVDDYEIVDTLPEGMTYEPGSADPEPVVTMVGGQQVLTWTLDDVETNVEHDLTYEASANTDVEPGTALTNTAESRLGGETSGEVDATVTTTTTGHTIIMKTSDVEYIPNDAGDGVGTGSWTVQIESFDPSPQEFTDTIDILPYNGDGRGTSFSGTYTLDDVVTPDGGTVYYTDADPTTLTDDPDDPDNGEAGDPSGNTVGWTTTEPANPTAIRVIGGELNSGETFEFQVEITTDGAEPQDVYVNRAQARAEHTELVMRTSAELVVTDYVVEKSSDPPSETTVKPGDVIDYTITVTQEGSVPAGAWFDDDVSDVFDDATYNNDLTADIGNVALQDGVISWDGEIPVGEVATITYSVTVKDVEGLAEEGSYLLDNEVDSPGCPDPDEGQCGTEHPVGVYEYSKTSDPEPGATVQVDDVITYQVRIDQVGEGPVEDAWIEDDLSAALDDADWNDDIEASSGEASLQDSMLRWTGDLDVGDVVMLTYSVTVTDEGDNELVDVVTNGDLGRCVPAPDENPDCTTDHYLGDYEVVKTSDPVSGESVEVGDEVTYTVMVSHIGIAPVDDAWFDEDLSNVLDDSTYNGDLTASAGEASVDGESLSWTGELDVGDVVEVTYSVTVTAEGDRHLVNVVTPGGRCVPAEGQDEACTTEHFNGAYTYAKTSDPEPGSEVEEGDVVTYTVTVEHVGTAPVDDAHVEDDLSAALDDAAWNDDAQASSGEVSYGEPTLSWAGDLDVGDVVTLTYSVTATADGDRELQNVVTSDDDRSVCVPAADGNPDCATEHNIPPVAKAGLPHTGANLGPISLAGLAGLLIGLMLVVAARQHREIASGERTVGFDDLF